MATKLTACLDGESEAHRLVGKFLQCFALLEQALDAGIGKLLSLDGGKNDIVCSSIPFAKKLGVFFSAEGLLAAIPEKDRAAQLNKTRSAILELNTKRVMFAHSPFCAHHGGGLSFRRVVADKKLDVSTVILSTEEVGSLCTDAANLIERIENLLNDMKPYVPALDFSDPRNSMYLAAL